MRLMYKLILIFTFITITGCASKGPGVLTSNTSKPVSVDASEDNSKILSGLTPGLVLLIKVSDGTASLVDSYVAMVPVSTPRRQEGELINILGLSSGVVVTETTTPDQSVKVEENKGIVKVAEQTLTTTLPLPQQIDTVQIKLPGVEEPQSFEVGKQVRKFCKEYPNTDICSGNIKQK